MFTLQTSFKPFLLKGGEGSIILVEVTVNSKEKTPNYVQEFGLRKRKVYRLDHKIEEFKKCTV
jgi:hypothetical protein